MTSNSRRHEPGHRLDRDRAANQGSKRQRQAPEPQSTTDLPDDLRTEAIVGNGRGLKHRLENAVLCVFDFLSHVDDL